MRRRSIRGGLAALPLIALLGCAVGGLTPVGSNQPVARQALAPEFRVFYDALSDYGDWILIEPMGFVFRPRVTWNQWKPFADGYWAPTDTWGWVWISAEPFGWATYHYGFWSFDRFQGWVWEPGVDWTPGSVQWLLAGDYVGWGPLTPRDRFGNAVRDAGGTTAMSFAPIAQLGSTNLSTRLVSPDQMGAALAEAKPVQNYERVDGLTVNRGPDLGLVEQRTGPLVRARIEDLVPGDLGRRVAGLPSRGPGREGGTAPNDSSAAFARQEIERAQAAGERAAQEARQLLRMPRQNPSVVPMVRPLFGRRGDDAPSRDTGAAPADTTR